MNDNPFAPPRDHSGPDTESTATTETATVRVHDEAPPTNDTVELPPAISPQRGETEAGTDTTAVMPTQAFSQPEDPATQAYLPPAEPPADTPSTAAAPQPGRLRRSTVAAVAAGALVLGLGGGLAGAWAYDSFSTDSSSAASSSTGSGTSTLPTSSSSTIARTDENTVAAIASAVMPSVVSIENIQGGQEAAEGSGFIIREDGYILTNNHVVDGSDNDTVTVVMSDGSEYDGQVVGATADYDLAVVKIDKDGLTPLVLGDSDELVVGDDVVAVGSPLGLESTVTTGIVSALHRPVTAGETGSTAFIDAIQTDAAINPGNSGGPLINSQGQVIGINSAIASLGSSSGSQAGSVGLGFAITSNQARRTAEEIIATGEATYPVVGVMLDSSYTGEGVKVAETDGAVAEGGPAAEAGIEPGDIITAIDGRPITRSEELIVAIRAKASDDTVVLTVERGGDSQDISVTLVPNTDVSYGDSGEQDQGGLGDGGGLPFPDPSE
ncbi:S1C family serine protease [Demequina phytophila]|uniref:S1C family serine protease n=1 Tax=Demequina phytophila TaxID=1638981 RepID=UPI000782367E|nr:trypsin-like peptidase domain-containing protein [Demequina phytophila]